jgi:hypothetical protein
LIGLGLALGIAGLLRNPLMPAASAAVGLAMILYGRGFLAVPIQRGNVRGSLLICRLILVVVILFAAWRAVMAAEYDYDVLICRLTFPAQWAQDGEISILPTWFGDPSPGYGPCATEVYYTSLLLPLGSDTFARAGQFPFWLLLLAAVVGLGRELRLRKIERIWLGIAVALIPAILAQSCTAMVDLAVAAHVLAIVFFSLRLVRRRDWTDAVGLILSGGLLVGTKYLTLAFLPALTPLVAWAIARRWSVRKNINGQRWIAASLVLALWVGGFWYVRNWVVTGNPLYPLEVRAGSHVVFSGVADREAMENSIFNVRREGGLSGFGGTFWDALHSTPPPSSGFQKWMLGTVALAMALCLFGAIALSRRRVRVGPLFFLLSTIGLFLAYWYLLPFQQGRFAWAPIVLTVCGASAAARCYRHAPIALLMLAAVSWTVAFGPELTGMVARAASLDDPRSAAMKLPRWEFYADSWRWIDQNVHGTTIAYSGNNLPYFLYGRRFENRVCYVPACRPLHGRIHDYAVMPEVRRLARPNTSEPTLDRVVMDPAIWLENAKALGVEYVFVNSLQLAPNLLINVRHDAQGFPIEREWLDAWCQSMYGKSPFAEVAVFGQGGVRLYRLHWDRPVSASGMTRIVRDEIDALDRMRQDHPPPGVPIRDYPLARGYIEQNGLRPIARHDRR